MGKILAKFYVKYLQILDEKGNFKNELMPKLSKKDIKKMYRLMVLTRIFDDRAVKYQRQGRMGAYASSLGQEASQIGSAIALSKEDFVFPSFREHGVFITRGVSLDSYYSYWRGDERGMNIKKGINILPVSIPVGSHPLHAVGTAMGFKYKREKKATIAYFGDGATSEGDFHEAMNFAGVFKAPVIFLCQNNQYAISVPVEKQTYSKSIAQKSIAYGFEGIRVDGNDIFSVYKATVEALKKAKNGDGPTLIECFTFRMGDHTTSDNAKKYRDEKIVEEWKNKDPINRLKNYMKKLKIFSKNEEIKIKKECTILVESAFKKSELIKKYNPSDIFNYLFKEPNEEIQNQINSMLEKK